MDARYLPDDLSVVILTYNKPQRLQPLLSLIPKGIEVVVADDGTVPSIRELLPPRVKLYTHAHDGNRASTCRNEGAKLTTRKKILFLDDDVTPHGLCFAAHSLALEMYDMSLGLLMREKWVPSTDDRTVFYIQEDQSLWNWCWSGNLAVQRDVFFSVGGFDADIFNGGHGFEDMDFARRCFINKQSMCLNRFALAHHPGLHNWEDPSEAVLLNQQKYNEKWDEVAG